MQLTIDLATEVQVPVVSKPETRSPGALHAAADFLAVQRRYAKRDVTGDAIEETFCNFFVREGLRMLSVDVPRLRANDMIDWLGDVRGKDGGWEYIRKPWIARSLADSGSPVVVGWKNSIGRPGHVAIVMPPRVETERGGVRIWIAQAGATNFAHGTLAQGFGNLPTTFFAHP
jgi:hypothetical protein